MTDSDNLSERLRIAFATCCARERVAARLVGAEDDMRFEFDGQENAPGDLMLTHFLVELRKAGVDPQAVTRPRATGEDEFGQLLRGLDHAVARMRTLLIEHNSFLQGGIPWVFAGGPEELRRGGLAYYRFPKNAAVDLAPHGQAMRISFAPGPLGEITSSGFYVPTPVRGDFDASIQYHIIRFEPGPDSACLALFAHDEPSTVRYYSQLHAAGRPPRFIVQSNLRNDLSMARPARAEDGQFRLERRGRVVRAYHRHLGGDWQLLGERADDLGAPMILGSKIWSKVECGGLQAELSNLEVAR